MFVEVLGAAGHPAGTFDAKTYGSHSKGTPDPKDTDHVVKGKFRIRHELTSMSGDRF